MNPSKQDPIYLLSPDDDILDKYANMIMTSVANDAPPLTITVKPEMVRSHDASEPHNVILPLQHCPDYIDYDVIHEQYMEDVNNNDKMTQRMSVVLNDYFELKEGK